MAKKKIDPNRLLFTPATVHEIEVVHKRLAKYGMKKFCKEVGLTGKTDYQQMWNRMACYADAQIQKQVVLVIHLMLDQLETGNEAKRVYDCMS